MIPLGTLRQTVRQALGYLHSLKEIKEVEVFASSNTQLLTRLNYTSHIPCNGVEEPKSLFAYGIGVRAVFRTPDGLRVGFGSEPSDLTIEGVKSAIAKARQGAVFDPEFVSLPKPFSERRKLTRYHDPALMALTDAHLVEVGWRTIRGALRTFTTSPHLASLAGGRSKIPSLGLILGGDVTILQERIAVASTHLPDVQTDESTLILSFLTAMVEKFWAKGSRWSAGTRLTDFTGDAGTQAARAAIASIGGVRVRDGVYRVILGPQPVTDLMTHLLLPALSASTFYAGSSPFQGRMGQEVASREFSLFDHGALRGFAGSKGVTCEGLPTGRTDLIREGILVGLLCNHYESQRLRRDPNAREKLGVDPTRYRQAFTPRNGFRFGRGGGRHFDLPPGISATNVVVEGRKPLTSQALCKGVGDGLYIGRIWYTYPINGLAAGDFTCTVVGDSYIIKDGKIATPLKPNTVRINDNILELLTRILGIGQKRQGTFVWAADELVYAPEIAIEGVRITEIAEYVEGL
jgi:hypothetical protein